MEKFKFTYGIQGVRFFTAPYITIEAFNKGSAEIEVRNKLKSRYKDRAITHLQHV